MGFTITTFDEKAQRIFEPHASTVKGRVDAVKQLSAAGIPTWVFIAPMLPHVTEIGLEDGLRQLKDAGGCRREEPCDRPIQCTRLNNHPDLTSVRILEPQLRHRTSPSAALARLSALPRELADFVVLHEISHLREFNHSRRFRYTLATLCPDFKEKEATLKRYAYD